jgi:predicted lipoprotein
MIEKISSKLTQVFRRDIEDEVKVHLANPGSDIRILIARLARSEARDAVQEVFEAFNTQVEADPKYQAFAQAAREQVLANLEGTK